MYHMKNLEISWMMEFKIRLALDVLKVLTTTMQLLLQPAMQCRILQVALHIALFSFIEYFFHCDAMKKIALQAAGKVEVASTLCNVVKRVAPQPQLASQCLGN